MRLSQPPRQATSVGVREDAIMKDRIVVLGFAALATVGAAGWMRQPGSRSNDFADQVQAPVMTAAAPQPDATNSVVRYAVYNETPARPVARPRVHTVASRDQQRYNQRYDQQPSYSRDRYGEPVIQPERSKGKSAAIIVGGAAAGAAIGAMAGHGKGAAIGAITGGVAGTIYDRMTHKKTDGWGWGR